MLMKFHEVARKTHVREQQEQAALQMHQSQELNITRQTQVSPTGFYFIVPKQGEQSRFSDSNQLQPRVQITSQVPDDEADSGSN